MELLSKKRMLLVFNPKSGIQNFNGKFFEVVDKFTGAGFIVTAYPTQAPGECDKIIAAYAGGYDCLVCSGGDGTIGEAINSLLTLEKRPVFGIIPSGTINDFAASLGIPRDIIAAADVITNSRAKLLDIGLFGKRHFSYVAAFGMFTDVPYVTPQNAKNLLGKLAYFLEGIKHFGRNESFRCHFVLDGEELKGDFILGIVGNAHSIAGIRLPVEMGVKMDDGLFEVILIQKPRSLKDHQEIIAALMTQDAKTDLLTVRKASKITFTSKTPLAWTLDGDFGGEYKELAIENMHRAIELITPAKTV